MDSGEVELTRVLSPRDYLRARRPELYSDSSDGREPMVNAAFLHFTLEQVTERKEEVAFEHLCRKLAEKEVCPNLIPQTGPTGGGDSKVDTETYPVSDDIAERWYIGDPARASKERWAFAFSAKRDWRSKLRDDVRKVVETGRGYTVVYFMTNQQVPDRTRGTLEDQLSREGNIDVRIFDRNWIADKVLTKGYYELFESTLQVNLGGATTRRLGQADAERERDLEALESQISDTGRYVGVAYQLAEDCLETAMLARGLDRPRIEVDGRFDRAERNSVNERQLLRINYNRAWTAVFWYEDYAEFKRLYKAVATVALRTNNVWDLEQVVTLWQVGTALHRKKGILESETNTDWKKLTEELHQAVQRIADDHTRPTSSLVSRTLLNLMKMVAEQDRQALFDGLKEIGSILEAARHHLDYPFGSTARVVEELVNLAGGDGGLDELLEKVIKMQAERGGEAEEGRLRLKRASACMSARRHREAIRQAGNAQLLLGRGGSRDEFLRALIVTAAAYEAMGLLWAARANYAFALHWALLESDATGELPPSVYIPLTQLIWVEIQLGRVPQTLCWLEFHNKLRNAVDLTEKQVVRLTDEACHMDAALAIVVLKTQWIELPKLDRAPSVLRKLGLPLSRSATMFLLGYDSAVSSEADLDNPEEFFNNLLVQPAARDVAEIADWGSQRSFVLRTILFGCEIELLAEEGLESLLLGETILAFLESLLATSSMSEEPLSARAQLSIEVVVRDAAAQPFEHDLVEDDVGDVKIVVAHRNDFVEVVDEQYLKTMVGLFAHVIAQLWLPMSKEHLEALFAKERPEDRLSLTAQLPVVLESTLGRAAKVKAQDWMEQESESLALRRTAPWRSNSKVVALDKLGKRGGQAGASGHEGGLSSSVDAFKHRDTKVLSVLNTPLWDRAQWKGVVYAFARDEGDIPQMCFSFQNIDAGHKIFRGWLRKFGATDPNDTIELTLVTGINRVHPDWYRLVVGHRIENFLKFDARLLGATFRVNELTPPNGRNLGQFLERYRRLGRYRIGPVEYSAKGGTFVLAQREISIEKRLLQIVPAWTIGPDDILRVALRDEDNPIVPSGEKDPPFRRSSTRNHRHTPGGRVGRT